MIIKCFFKHRMSARVDISVLGVKNDIHHAATFSSKFQTKSFGKCTSFVAKYILLVKLFNLRDLNSNIYFL